MVIYREYASPHAHDDAYANVHDRLPCADAHGESYVQGDALTDDASDVHPRDRRASYDAFHDVSLSSPKN
jgi:hypothetical protein